VASAKAGLQPPGPAKAIFTSSESLLSWQRRQIEETLGVPVYDRYGCAEFCVSFTVCPEGRYHLDSEFSIVEIEPLVETAESVQGPLLCTGLMNHAMPFIRYRVGDVATIAKTPCACGHPSLSALAIDGRSEDFVLTRDGVRLGRMDHLFKDMHAVHESQILQDRPGRIKIRIVRTAEYSTADEHQLLHECSKRMRETPQGNSARSSTQSPKLNAMLDHCRASVFRLVYV
jgi:phenylacetate-CoA ligase